MLYGHVGYLMRLVEVYKLVWTLTDIKRKEKTSADLLPLGVFHASLQKNNIFPIKYFS